MDAQVDVAIDFCGMSITVGNAAVFVLGRSGPGKLTPDQAKRLAQLLELAANAVEKALEMGENDD